jgi:glycerophosphoryl diester phosphodiesterase
VSIHAIAHRGLWEHKDQQNTVQSCNASFAKNFGVEIDLRKINNKIVISHDHPISIDAENDIENFFSKQKFDNESPYIFFDIKEAGLVSDIDSLITKYSILNYFVFDMSVVDHVSYIKRNIKTLSRLSKYEASNTYLAEKASGICLDLFEENTIDFSSLKLDKKRPIFVISPELHKLEYKKLWEQIKEVEENYQVYLCTDFPDEAVEYFNE